MIIPSTFAKKPKMTLGRSTAHQNEFWDTFLIKLLIRNNYPQHPCQKPENPAWTVHGSPKSILDIFLITLLIRNDYPQHPCQNPKMRPGRPKAHQNEFWDTFLIKMLIRNDYPQHPCQNQKNEARKAQGSTK